MMIILEYLDTSLMDDALLKRIPDLPEQTQLKNQQARTVYRQRLAGRALLRSVLARYFDLTDPVFETQENGRPYLANLPKLDFNLSHSGDIVFCVVLEKGANQSNRVGADVELINTGRTAERIPALCARYFSEAEEKLVITETGIDTAAFYRIWTGKESIVKYTGAGIGDISPQLDSRDTKFSGRLFHYTLTDSRDRRYAASVLLPRGFVTYPPEIRDATADVTEFLLQR